MVDRLCRLASKHCWFVPPHTLCTGHRQWQTACPSQSPQHSMRGLITAQRGTALRHVSCNHAPCLPTPGCWWSSHASPTHSSFSATARRRTTASAPGLSVASHGAQPPGRGHAARCGTRPSTRCAGRPHASAPRAPPGVSLSRARPVCHSRWHILRSRPRRACRVVLGRASG
jgi:hypothetical protein